MIQNIDGITYLYNKKGQDRQELKEQVKDTNKNISTPYITYKKILSIILDICTEEQTHEIFVNGGINMCPTDILGHNRDYSKYSILNKQKEEDICNYESVGCLKCWNNAIQQIQKYNELNKL